MLLMATTNCTIGQIMKFGQILIITEVAYLKYLRKRNILKKYGKSLNKNDRTSSWLDIKKHKFYANYF